MRNDVDKIREDLRRIQKQGYAWIEQLGDLIAKGKLLEGGGKKNEGFALFDEIGRIQNEMTFPCLTSVPTQPKTITNLRIIGLTDTQAVMQFEISPIADVQVEIDSGSGFVQLANTGLFAFHNYEIHSQTTLSPETLYTIRLTPVDGSPVCTIRFVTDAAATDFVNFNPLLGRDTGADNATLGNWTAIDGKQAPNPNEPEFIKATILANSNEGASWKTDIPGTEAYVSFCVCLGSNFTPTSAVKLPGFSAQTTGGPGTGIGGQGGGGSGGSLSWSERMLIQHPGTIFTFGGLGHEMYYDSSSNAPFGETMWWGNLLDEASPQPEASIADGQWHCITLYKKLNDANQNNGISRGWLDGVLLFERTDIGSTDNPAYQNLSFWFAVYHGGVADTSGTNHDIYFGGFNYSVGPTNNTQCRC